MASSLSHKAQRLRANTRTLKKFVASSISLKIAFAQPNFISFSFFQTENNNSDVYFFFVVSSTEFGKSLFEFLLMSKKTRRGGCIRAHAKDKILRSTARHFSSSTLKRPPSSGGVGSSSTTRANVKVPLEHAPYFHSKCFKTTRHHSGCTTTTRSKKEIVKCK